MNASPKILAQVALCFLLLISPALAAPKAATVAAYSAGNADNLTVGTAVIRNSFERGTQRREVRAVVSGNKNGPAQVECYYVVDNKGASKVLLAGQNTCTGKEGVFDFRMESRDNIAGWYVRLIKGGRIVGSSGSSEKFTEMGAKAQ